MADKHWIKGAIKHPGALRADLHVPKGKTIPVSKLRRAAKEPGVLGRRARLAIILKGLHR